ncbi:PAS domain-containing protein [Pseudochrobactrum sp. sp1633]|uniref:PAS domain-containing protein n=1 Tax=Pseudochrobactrum sp. sp1633 TaxID=3036706 RepID=UPI0025A51ED5|nr:PAS domain-containing protein [Pseudochrobactrum sp. sp1633]MDM8343882.1 PAS domain-containing protein [Pseudochrobactrum sp. sp1633]HWD11726.1 PAS domain-containing protein [Pseudochrobactrum sp.]
MKHDWTADLLTYWDRLRGTRAAPDRRDISPRDLGGKLPNIFILRGDHEASATTANPDSTGIPQPKQWQFRLAGTRLCTIYGRELRNTRFLSLWHDDVRLWLAEQLHLSGLDYRPLRLEHTGLTLTEKACHFESLLLPLHEADGSLAWIGSMVPLDQPLWLGSDPLISNHMGLRSETTPSAAQEDIAPATKGMKSVLQVLLDRHHELMPSTENSFAVAEATVPSINIKSKLEGAGVADTAFARALLPQIEALLPAARTSEPTIHHAIRPAPATGSAPLTVADLIKSIHPAAPKPESAPSVQKAAHLKLITGGKDKN